MKTKLTPRKITLFDKIRIFFKEGKPQISFAAYIALFCTYWRIGYRVNQKILKNKWSDYGKKIVLLQTRPLSKQYGVCYEEKIFVVPCAYMFKFLE